MPAKVEHDFKNPSADMIIKKYLGDWGISYTKMTCTGKSLGTWRFTVYCNADVMYFKVSTKNQTVEQIWK